MFKFTKDGQITIITLDLHWTTRSYSKEDLSLEELQLKKEKRTYFFTAVNPLSDSIHTFCSEEAKPRIPSLLIAMKIGAQCKLLVRFTARARQILAFRQTLQPPSHCTNPWLQTCLVQVVRRTQHDTEEEILFPKVTPVPRDIPRVVLKRSFSTRNWSKSSDLARGNSLQDLSKDDASSRKLVRFPGIISEYHKQMSETFKLKSNSPAVPFVWF